MNTFQIGGLAIGAIIALIGMAKIELLKEVIRKVTSDKEKISSYSILLLIAIAVIPAIIGFTLPSNIQADTPTQPIEQKDTRPKSDAEVISTGVKDAVILTNEIVEKENERKAEKKKAYDAAKPEKWVYQIGDWTEEKNRDALLNMSRKLKDIKNIFLFDNGSSVVFFQNEDHTKDELEASLNDFKAQLETGITIKIVNLMEQCTYRHPNLVRTNSIRVGKKKDKTKVDCYVCK